MRALNSLKPCNVLSSKLLGRKSTYLLLDTKLKAMSLLKTIQNQKIVNVLVFFNKLFDMFDFCTKGLQKTSLNVETTISLIETLKTQLREFEHQRVITYGLELAAKFEITEFGELVSSRWRDLSLALKTLHVMTTVGHNTESSVDDLVILLKRVISHISGELQARFDHDQLGVMRIVVAFCPSSPDFMDVKLLNSVSGGCGFTIPESEIDVLNNFLKDQSQLNPLSLIFSTWPMGTSSQSSINCSRFC